MKKLNNSIQFNSVFVPSKQQTHSKTKTQDGGDATKSKIVKNVASLLQVKTTASKQSKHSTKARKKLKACTSNDPSLTTKLHFEDLL